MAKADLSAARLRELLDYNPDTGIFNRKVMRGGHIGPINTKLRNGGYVCICVDKVVYPAHQLAWLYCFGIFPNGFIDHINGNRIDNRISNLRDVPRQTNNENIRRAKKNSKTGVLGVSPSRGGWMAQISVNYKTIPLGRFASIDEAHAAYLTAKRALHRGNTL